MTKLTTSIPDNSNKKQHENKSSSLSFVKKNKKEEEEANTETADTNQLKTVTENQIAQKTIKSPEDISNWLIGFLGDDMFEQIKTNPYLQLPYTDENIELKDWLVKAIKTIFKPETIGNIGQQIQENHNKLAEINAIAQQAQQEKQQIEERLTKAQTRFEQIKNETDNAEDEKFQIEKKLRASIELSQFIDDFFDNNESKHSDIEKLVRLFKESLSNLNENLSTFLIKFGKGWMFIQAAILQFNDDEKANMKQLHQALTHLMAFISQTHIPERRPALDLVASFVSSKFSEYEFISPEQTLQVDPAIHNAQGLGSNTVKEGVSFAVIRKESRQAVIYADIKVS